MLLLALSVAIKLSSYRGFASIRSHSYSFTAEVISASISKSKSVFAYFCTLLSSRCTHTVQCPHFKVHKVNRTSVKVQLSVWVMVQKSGMKLLLMRGQKRFPQDNHSKRQKKSWSREQSTKKIDMLKDKLNDSSVAIKRNGHHWITIITLVVMMLVGQCSENCDNWWNDDTLVHDITTTDTRASSLLTITQRHTHTLTHLLSVKSTDSIISDVTFNKVTSVPSTWSALCWHQLKQLQQLVIVQHPVNFALWYLSLDTLKHRDW